MGRIGGATAQSVKSEENRLSLVEIKQESFDHEGNFKDANVKHQVG